MRSVGGKEGRGLGLAPESCSISDPRAIQEVTVTPSGSQHWAIWVSFVEGNCLSPKAHQTPAVDLPGQLRAPSPAGKHSILTARALPQQPILLSYRCEAQGSPPGWSDVLWSGYPHSLEDEGHRLLPVLPLEWQGSRGNLKLQSNVEHRADESTPSFPIPISSGRHWPHGGALGTTAIPVGKLCEGRTQCWLH